jgi:hypothetical protein
MQAAGNAAVDLNSVTPAEILFHFLLHGLIVSQKHTRKKLQKV